ncbi:class I SAM-dependent methyltransferase [Patescibacteria group bacterium]
MSGSRAMSHFQGEEAWLEPLLRKLRYRRVRRRIPENSSVLDIGCGFDAHFLHHIKDHIDGGVGIDLVINEENNDPLVKMVKHNANEPFPFEADSFDVVVSMANLEHLDAPQAALKEIHRALRPGGRLIMTVPSTYAKPVLEFLSFKVGIVSEEEIADHKMYFNKKMLQQLLEQAGFSNINHRYFQIYMNNFVEAVK